MRLGVLEKRAVLVDDGHRLAIDVAEASGLTDGAQLIGAQ